MLASTVSGVDPPARAVWFDMAGMTERLLAVGERPPSGGDNDFLWVDSEFSDPADVSALVEAGLVPEGALDEDRSAGEVAWAYHSDHVHLMLAGGRLDGAELVLDRRHVVITGNVVASVHRGVPDHFERVRGRYRDTFASFAKSHGFLVFEICGALVDDLHRLVRDLGDRIDELRLAVERPGATADGGSDLLVSVLLTRHILVRTRDLFAELSSRRSAFVPETTQPYLGDMAGRIDGLVGDLAFSRDVLSEAMRAAPAPPLEPRADEDVVPESSRRPRTGRAPIRFVGLGGFDVLREGDTIPSEEFGREGARQLLACLLCARRPVQTEELVSWLWPDLDEERATQALHVTVSALRAALERELGEGVESSVVLLESGAYRVELSEGDSWDVDEVLSAAGRAADREDPVERTRALVVALDSAEGPLYPEWPFAEWTADLRRECEQASREIRALLAESLLAADQPSDALGHFEALLDGEPGKESWHRGIMRCHSASGDRALALRQFHTCRSVLRQSRGVEPSPETQALYLALLKAGSS